MRIKKDLVLKPLYACNFACDFCSSPGDPNQRLSIKELVQWLKKAEQFFIFEKVILNGGEPCLILPEYYEELLAKTKIKSLYFQTNGKIFYESYKLWQKLLRDPRVSLGLSFQYGAHRKDNIGPFTEEKFLEYQKYFKKKLGHNLFFIYILMDDNGSREDIDRLIKLAKKLKVSFNLNPILLSGRGNKCYLPNYKTLEIYNYILQNYREEVLHIFPLRSFLLEEYANQHCPYGVCCQNSIFSIEPTGEIFPCASAGDRGINRIGNIKEDIVQLVSCRKVLNPTIQLKKECLTCEYYYFCHSCYIRMQDVLTESPTTQFKYCQQMKLLAERIKKLRTSLGRKFIIYP